MYQTKISKINDLSFQSWEIKTGNQVQVIRRKYIIKVRREINIIENRELIEKKQ